ncbi:hypothetical protein Syun_017433 [Stephania yunnanensis]|uniref:Uncharacterized protein n=1 Tax=Stephania yunnanensis TaxID=152371 RepID=A0AAP0P5U5_9MAGN
MTTSLVKHITIYSSSEGDHLDYSKSFVIGSVIFNILVGLKPRSFSPKFPITGEIQPYFRWDPSIDEAIELLKIQRRMLDFKARSKKASYNRNSEKGGLGTSPSKHTGGTRSFQTYEDVLALDKDEDDEVTPNDVFLHVHTKDHDGVTFIDNESTQFHVELVRRREEHAQATPDRPIDEKQLYYDAAGKCSKGRIYGLVSLAKRKRRYEDPEPVGNAYGRRSKHLSGTTTTTTSGASSVGWDGSVSFTIATAR